MLWGQRPALARFSPPKQAGAHQNLRFGHGRGEGSMLSLPSVDPRRVYALTPQFERELEPQAADAYPSSPSERESEGPFMPAEQALAIVLQSLEEDKAEEIVSLDIRGRSSFADHMIVASGRSNRHVCALADHVMRKLKEAGAGGLRVEGLPGCDWVLVDAGDLIVHLFRPEVRQFYNIEKMWAPPMPVGVKG